MEKDIWLASEKHNGSFVFKQIPQLQHCFWKQWSVYTEKMLNELIDAECVIYSLKSLLFVFDCLLDQSILKKRVHYLFVLSHSILLILRFAMRDQLNIDCLSLLWQREAVLLVDDVSQLFTACQSRVSSQLLDKLLVCCISWAEHAFLRGLLLNSPASLIPL